ncbi:HBL294Cp [Eremothecium sinecaudum]|uniref:HBL294Cp n=1 Tax=Eremothecium sinecaudum TaxID=45286 RepID=A0A109UW62_9SACH|nr:HBL294Cp [Eremothecium sinecaudum]AMD18608.1 HBL294Cp [Eremothecium sinecaudum]
MPRKKSAAKKAKLEAEKSKAQAQRAKVEETVKQDDEVLDSKSNRQDAIDVDVSGDTDSDSSSSEEEDDFGELVTEEVEEGIQNVLTAIRKGDKDKLLDPNVKFFEDPEEAAAKLKKTEKQKPIYLKDYHRMTLLSGGNPGDNEEFETVDGQQSYVSQKKEEKAQLLDEINEALGDNSNDEDEFLVKKEKTNVAENKTSLPDPEVDDEKFLEEFVKQQAWIPKKGDKILNLDATKFEEDDEEFDDAVEQFEKAYNFRYEDPNAAEIVSYARNQATLRRSASSSRRRKREEEKAEKAKLKEEKEKAIHKKKTETVHQITDVLERVKKEYGSEITEDMAATLTKTLLNDDYDDSKWDEVIGNLFNDEFYDKEGKPTFGEDDDIMHEFYEDGDVQHDEGSEEEAPAKKRKKDKKEEKLAKKQEKKQLAKLAEEAVEKNKLALIEKVEEERGRSKKTDDGLKFRYREVSPESFNLTTREILAADDAALNEYIGLKKFAPYRPKELRNKDKRKVTKSKRLREWRKKVFRNEAGLQDESEN